MTDRAYTVKDIDALRGVIEQKLDWGYYTGPHREDGVTGSICGAMWRQGERTQAVEEHVRTHMLAGHTAADLLASEAP
jgi:hypothetical protein